MALTRQNVPLINSKLLQQRTASGTFTAVALFAPQYNKDGTFKKNKDIFIGVGVRSVRVSQGNSVEPVMSMGYADFVDVAEHGVRSNSLTLSKTMMVDAQLAKIGVGSFGMANLASVPLNAVVYNTAWAQVDIDSGLQAQDQSESKQLVYTKATGLHLQDNNLSFASQTANTEDLTFIVTKFEDFEADDLAFKVLERMSKMTPEFYSNNFGYNSHQKFTESGIYTAN